MRGRVLVACEFPGVAKAMAEQWGRIAVQEAA